MKDVYLELVATLSISVPREKNKNNTTMFFQAVRLPRSQRSKPIDDPKKNSIPADLALDMSG